MLWIYDLPLWLLGILVLSASVLFAFASVLLVRARGWRLQGDDNASAAALHAFIGVLYAVALGLMVVSAQEANSDVEHAVQNEANAVGNLYRISAGLEPAQRDRLRGQIFVYVRSVLQREWSATRNARTDTATWQAMDRLADGVYRFTPASPAEERVYPQLVNEMEEVLDARRDRLFLGTRGAGGITWAVVLLGGMVTIAFSAFFHLGRPRVQLLLTSLAAGMLGLMILLLLAMDHPLWGRAGVRPGPFVELERTWMRLRAQEGSAEPGPLPPH
jgi:hypothetical protein